jgi:hypothetical protein
MDSAMQLALMTKAKKVFGADDTFLSFPVSPLPYKKRDLDFFSARNTDDLRQSQRNLQAFSTLVNLIPDDEAWLPTDTTALWDVYEQVLREANFAESSRTPEEETAYQQALAFLRVEGEGGVFEDSAAVKIYKQHKDAFLFAEQKFNADKVTGDNAADLGEQKRWREVDEPAARAQIEDLRMKWITVGHKNEVDAAQAKVRTLGAKSPLVTLGEWNSRFNADIDSISGELNTSTIYPSFFSPSNAVEDGAWQPFKLSAEEVSVLINEAPPELRARFAANNTAAGKSLTFEFSSAAIQRPWFASEVFRARFWRFTDEKKVISDGGKPAKGQCPAYVTAIVFARRVKEEEKRVEATQPTILVRPGRAQRQPVTAFTGFNFAVAVKDRAILKQIQDGTLQPAHRHLASDMDETTPMATDAPASRMVGRVSTTARNPAMMRRPVAKPTRGRPAGTRPAGTRPVATRPVATRKATASHLRHLRALTFNRPAGVFQPMQPTKPTTTTPVTTPPVTTTPAVQDDSIFILAFICKSVPKCPDPDPTLKW